MPHVSGCQSTYGTSPKDSLRLICAESIEQRVLDATCRRVEPQECAGEAALWCIMRNTVVNPTNSLEMGRPWSYPALRHGATEGTQQQPLGANTQREE